MRPVRVGRAQRAAVLWGCRMSATDHRPLITRHMHVGAGAFNVHERRVYRIADIDPEGGTVLLRFREHRRVVSYADLAGHYRTVQPYAEALR